MNGIVEFNLSGLKKLQNPNCINPTVLFPARGNVRVCGEFNFVTDPEAASVVLSHFTCPVYIATLEYCLHHRLTWDFYRKWVNHDSAKARFMEKISALTADYSQGDVGGKELVFGSGFVSCDSYAVSAAIDDSLVTKRAQYGVSVELQGSLTRGTLDILKLQHKATVFLECDMEKYKQLMINALK
ncbi:nucleoside hydrolase-like [Rhinoraja longicauda]